MSVSLKEDGPDGPVDKEWLLQVLHSRFQDQTHAIQSLGPLERLFAGDLLFLLNVSDVFLGVPNLIFD